MFDALQGYNHTSFEISFKLHLGISFIRYAQEACLLLLENTLLSLLRLIFFKKKSLLYWSSNDPYELSQLICTGLLMALKIFLFFEILRMAKCQLLFLLIRKILFA